MCRVLSSEQNRQRSLLSRAAGRGDRSVISKLVSWEVLHAMQKEKDIRVRETGSGDG